MTIANTIGSSFGKATAYVTEGTRLSSSQFAAGFRQGYDSKARELRAQREALGVITPVVRVKTRTAKA